MRRMKAFTATSAFALIPGFAAADDGYAQDCVQTLPRRSANGREARA